MKCKRFLPLLLSLALPVASFARETVYLKNGFTLEVDSAQQQGKTTILNTGSGTVEMPTDQISGIERLNEPKAAKELSLTVAIPPVAPEQLLLNAAVAQGVDAAFVRSVAVSPKSRDVGFLIFHIDAGPGEHVCVVVSLLFFVFSDWFRRWRHKL